MASFKNEVGHGNKTMEVADGVCEHGKLWGEELTVVGSPNQSITVGSQCIYSVANVKCSME